MLSLIYDSYLYRLRVTSIILDMRLWVGQIVLNL